ncbi:MAG: hydantoinase/oxoprolinase N-terminal domain-containing protein [bacterium]
MPIGLGIDTGGTYTDSAIVDLAGKKVLAKAKALTTHEDLTIGIKNSIENLKWSDLRKIDLVAISTTLATNASVEGKGARAGLILIGYDLESDADRGLLRDYNLILPQDNMPGGDVRIVRGRLSISGEELEPLDEDGARRAILEMKDEVSAFAVSSIAGIRNPKYELRVKEMIEELTKLPVVCGHDLTSELNMYRRAATALLNAQLIPIVKELIYSIRSVLEEKEIEAPLMIVRGDGSLISDSVAAERPIETILSGPAASVMGGKFLSGLSARTDRTEGTPDMAPSEMENGIAIDIGGTTTDIAILEDGFPKVSPKGARVGRWRTCVHSIDIATSGIGGDSYIRLLRNGQLEIGPERVIPLCLAAHQNPSIVRELEDLSRWNLDIGLVQNVDFFALSWRRARPRMSSAEEGIVEALREGPKSIWHLSRKLGLVHPYLLRIEELLNSGAIKRISLTPTDILHVDGSYREWNAEASNLATRISAKLLGISVEEFAKRARAKIAEKLFLKILSKYLEADEEALSRCDLYALLSENSHKVRARGKLNLKVSLKDPIIGIGAPVRAYLPSVAEKLRARLIVPEHSEVANAIGAVVGSVIERVEMTIQPGPEGGYICHLPEERREFLNLEEAVKCAIEVGKEEAERKARRAGARAIELRVERRDSQGTVSEEYGGEIFLETRVTITAVGRPYLIRFAES